MNGIGYEVIDKCLGTKHICSVIRMHVFHLYLMLENTSLKNQKNYRVKNGDEIVV